MKVLLKRYSDSSVGSTVLLQARKHADAAVENLHGSLLHGAELKIGFGKAIPIPPQPIYPRPQHVQHLHNHMASVAHGVANSVNRKAWGRGEVDEKVIHRVRASFSLRGGAVVALSPCCTACSPCIEVKSSM